MTTKIFISHSTKDADLVTSLMDMLQTQFNLNRDNFFCTSDEELDVGGNWIEQIRLGMEECTIVMPIITPNYMESPFCLCELGAAWVNQQNLVPVIIPPLDFNALSDTPYRSWAQAITLNTMKDLFRLSDAFNKRKIGTSSQMARFNARAEKFFENVLQPHIENLKNREIITAALVKQLREENKSYKEALKESDTDVMRLQEENQKLRQMKDAKEVKAMDFAKLSEWNEFLQAVQTTRESLNQLDKLAVSVLYHFYKDGGAYGGYVAAQDDLPQMRVLENEGLIKFDQGFEPDFGHPSMKKALQQIENLDAIIKDYEPIIKEKFEQTFEGVRLGLRFSPFWEKVIRKKIYPSAQ